MKNEIIRLLSIILKFNNLIVISELEIYCELYI